MNYAVSASVLVVLLLLAGCTQSSPSTPGTPNNPTSPGNSGGVESYIMKGYVTNSQGAPLEGAEVFADDTELYNSNIISNTDASGFYRLELPAFATTWNPGAYVSPTFDGEEYRISLVPDNDDVFAGVDGAVRNFTWKLSGETPEGDGYYGAIIYVYSETSSGTFEVEDVEFTLIPEGPLIDGSTGQTLVARPVAGEINDVPIGRYTISGQYTGAGGAGRSVLLADRNGDGNYLSSQTVSFINDSNYGPNIELFVRVQ